VEFDDLEELFKSLTKSVVMLI